MAEVKSSFEYQGRTWKSYWNGKKYAGDQVYVTVTSPSGSQAKVSFSPVKGVSIGGSHSIDLAKAALVSVNLIEA